MLAYPLVVARRALPVRARRRARRSSLGEPADEAERFAALLQGVAFVERLCFDYVDLLGAPTGGELTLTGGAHPTTDATVMARTTSENPLSDLMVLSPCD